jgi:molybdopterin molybdotransferase
MKEFFKVESIEGVLAHVASFPSVDSETVSLAECLGRVTAEDVYSDVDIPDFNRSTMDGFAVKASSTFGASEANPAYLNVRGQIRMGGRPDFSIGPGEAARIATGGMLPEGADSVIMVEHTDALDDTTIEAYRSVAPGQHVIEKGEDIRHTQSALKAGTRIRPQEAGLLAACGRSPRSPFSGAPGWASSPPVTKWCRWTRCPVKERSGTSIPRPCPAWCWRPAGCQWSSASSRTTVTTSWTSADAPWKHTDMVMISGGSSVGARDFTVEVLDTLPDTAILVHGISISPGKPTILARSGGKAFWGLPGHAVSAMVVFAVVVRPFLDRLCGLSETARCIPGSGRFEPQPGIGPGRVDFVRVRLFEARGVIKAEPILGKSGLINTMVQADGLIAIGMNTEGLDQGAVVEVMPL